MNKRPVSVTIIACLYIAVGGIDFAYHFIGFKPQRPFQYDIVWASLVSLIAVVCGVYMLRSRNWARWLALTWIVFHVVLSAFHALGELALHTLFCVILAYFLFRPTATRYFRGCRNVSA
jgi:hypothetical protein